MDFVLAHEKASNEIDKERGQQDLKWGVQNHDAGTWALILLEEIGEWAKAELERRFGEGSEVDCKTEAVQMSAVSKAIVECMLRNSGCLPQKSERLPRSDDEQPR
jgi:hypothetical protein